MFDLQKMLTDLCATGNRVKFETIKSGTLFLWQGQPDTFPAPKDPSGISPGDLAFVYVAGPKKQHYRQAIRINGDSFPLGGCEDVLVIDSEHTATVKKLIEKYKDDCLKVDNVSKLQKIKKLFEDLNVGYTIRIKESDWSSILEVSDETLYSDKMLFNSLTGVYEKDSDAWFLDSALERLLKIKADRVAAQVHKETVIAQWHQIPDSVKCLAEEARKLGIA